MSEDSIEWRCVSRVLRASSW